MIPVSTSNSFSSLYSSAHINLCEALKGRVYNQEKLNLQKIFKATDKLLSKIRASLYNNTLISEPDIKDVYYDKIIWYLLKFRQLSKDLEKHPDADLFLISMRCFESLQRLASDTRSTANKVGIELKPYNEVDLQKDYVLGGNYIGDVSGAESSFKTFQSGKQILGKREKKKLSKAPKNLLEYFKVDKREIAEKEILPLFKDKCRNAGGLGLAVFWLALEEVEFIDHPYDKEGGFLALFNLIVVFLEGENGGYKGFIKQISNLNTKHLPKRDKWAKEFKEIEKKYMLQR